MSRAEAKRRFTVEDHKRMTEGVECRKDADVIDETPAAYKPIEAVMAAQRDLVEIAHTLHQVVCVKGVIRHQNRHTGSGHPLAPPPHRTCGSASGDSVG